MVKEGRTANGDVGAVAEVDIRREVGSIGDLVDSARSNGNLPAHPSFSSVSVISEAGSLTFPAAAPAPAAAPVPTAAFIPAAAAGGAAGGAGAAVASAAAPAPAPAVTVTVTAGGQVAAAAALLLPRPMLLLSLLPRPLPLPRPMPPSSLPRLMPSPRPLPLLLAAALVAVAAVAAWVAVSAAAAVVEAAAVSWTAADAVFEATAEAVTAAPALLLPAPAALPAPAPATACKTFHQHYPRSLWRRVGRTYRIDLSGGSVLYEQILGKDAPFRVVEIVARVAFASRIVQVARSKSAGLQSNLWISADGGDLPSELERDCFVGGSGTVRGWVLMPGEVNRKSDRWKDVMKRESAYCVSAAISGLR